LNSNNPNPDKYKTLTGVLIVFAGALCFSAKSVMVKLVLNNYAIDPLSILVLRMVFSFPFFLAAALYTNYTRPSALLNSKDWGLIIFLGFIGYYLASLFDFEGLKYVSASLERLILFIYPTFVVLIAAVFFKKPFSRKELIALSLTYLGLAIAFSNDITLHSDQGIKGALLILLSAFTYAIYLSGSGKLLPRMGTVNYTSWTMIISTFSAVFHFMVVYHTGIFSYPAEVYLICLCMAILSTVIPAFMISEGIRRIGPSKASIVGTIGPVSTIVLAHFILGESITILQMTGTLFIIAGILLIGKEKPGKPIV
jgi:drug/metabolite transporter (DMT)-like permease